MALVHTTASSISTNSLSSTSSNSAQEPSKLAISSLLSPSNHAVQQPIVDSPFISIHSLPPNVLSCLLRYLHKKDWISLLCTCKSWYRLFQDPLLWWKLLFTNVPPPLPSPSTTLDLSLLQSRYFHLSSLHHQWKSITATVIPNFDMHPDLNLILIDTFLPTHDLWMVHLDPLESCLVFTVYPGGVFTHPYSSSTLKYRYLYPKGHSIRVAAMEYTTHVALVKTPMKPIPPPYTQIDILNLATSLRIMSLVLAEDPLVLVQLHFPSHIESHFQKTYFTPKGQRHLGMVAGYPYHLSFMYHSRTTPDICVAQHRFEFDQELLDIQWENSHIYVVSIHEHQVAYIWHGLQFQQLHRLVLNHEPEFPNSLLFMYGDTDPFYILTLNESTVLFHLSSSTSQFTFPPYLIPRDQHHDLDPHIVLWPPYFFFLTSDYYLLMYDFSHFPSFQPVRITCVDMYTQITHQPRSEKTSRELSRWFGDTKLLGFWITAHPTLSVWVHVHRKHLAKELYCVQAASQSSNQNDSRTHAS